jgi:hypothetical protein
MRPEGLDVWLAERGVEGARRVVAVDDRRILLSKTPEGFAERLFEAVEAMEDALRDEQVAAAMAALSAPTRSRVDAWEAAVMRCVADQAAKLGLPATVVEEVRFGVESVAALLRAVSWRDLPGDRPVQPTPAERAAFRDLWESIAGDGKRFTRVYGVFDGRVVVAHCPGARLARTLLAQGWHLCTGDAVPERS